MIGLEKECLLKRSNHHSFPDQVIETNVLESGFVCVDGDGDGGAGKGHRRAGLPAARRLFLSSGLKTPFAS